MGDMADYYGIDQMLDAEFREEARRKRAEFWQCKDGRRLSPREMTTEHLRNAIAMLDRRYHELYAPPLFWSADEAHEWHTSVPRSPKIEEVWPVYETLRAELASR